MYSKSTWKSKYIWSVIKYKYKYWRFPRNVLEYIPSTLQIVLKYRTTDVLKYKVLLPGSDPNPPNYI